MWAHVSQDRPVCSWGVPPCPGVGLMAGNPNVPLDDSPLAFDVAVLIVVGLLAHSSLVPFGIDLGLDVDPLTPGVDCLASADADLELVAVVVEPVDNTAADQGPVVTTETY